MIPLRLSLQNFLSYQQALLDFRGLHTACICGANGSGKSSLLEAISWALWGQSRATSEDDVIHTGMSEARVDFIFQMHQQVYRVIRTRQRGQATVLDLQVATAQVAPSHNQTPIPTLDMGESTSIISAKELSSHQCPVEDLTQQLTFRSLTLRGLRATQQLILDRLRLDYDTFVNSAYLRQGRADEFMLKRPSERKQILATLLKLDQYDELAERARDLTRQRRAAIEVLEQQYESVGNALQREADIADERLSWENKLVMLQRQQEADDQQWQALQARQQQRQQWQQQLAWQQQQQAVVEQECDRLRQELEVVQQHYQQLDALLQQESVILVAYQQLQALQAEDDELTAKFHAHQQAWEQRQALLEEQAALTGELQAQLRRLEAQREVQLQQQQELRQILEKAPTIADALAKLHQARDRLQQLDDLQAMVTPLWQRRQQLHTHLALVQARLSARLDELRLAADHYHQQYAHQAQLQQAALDVAERLDYLEQRRRYQEQLREKGIERRSFMDQLQAHQRDYEAQLGALDQKVQFLQQPDAVCPLCDRPLDQHHWNLVLQKHKAAQQEIQNQLWVVREQLVTSEREIQVLRREYKELERELQPYAAMWERRGQLQQELQRSIDSFQQWQRLQAEQAELTHALEQNEFAQDIREELAALEQQLATITAQKGSYDEKDHALVRGEVERWRWAEIKQAELKQTQLRLNQLIAQQPELEATIAHLEKELATVKASPLQQQLDALNRYLEELGYDRQHHITVQTALRQAQPWQLRYQELQQAQQQAPHLQQQIADLESRLHQRTTDLAAIRDHIAHLRQSLADNADDEEHLARLAQQRQQRRAEMDTAIAHLGRLQQQQHHLDNLRQQYSTLHTQLQTLRHQQR
ncbi:MAG: SMC family ATPase, partial [Cyanobacteria bacterium]|nr:SMC family ATPase [Cyanobacteriota bacterium]MDW8201475.1 SMC family ATPase [Cyanobacteriota bacterium SKYGB_h_bin112]